MSEPSGKEKVADLTVKIASLNRLAIFTTYHIFAQTEEGSIS